MKPRIFSLRAVLAYCCQVVFSLNICDIGTKATNLSQHLGDKPSIRATELRFQFFTPKY